MNQSPDTVIDGANGTNVEPEFTHNGCGLCGLTKIGITRSHLASHPSNPIRVGSENMALQ
ncbi:hypothetical protein EDB83DRAFT_2554129 [Lactarius deliciosus]|nr:hypothetical protein EDB83DRAFT_2554129 [Lactarius deliciosus]